MVGPLQEALSAMREQPHPLHQVALLYAAADLAVFPCVPGAKQPLTEHGYRDATTDTRRIRRWWAWQPTANIGIATGHGLDVLDIDVHAGGDGYAVLERLRRAGLVEGALAAVRTPSGGAHLYFPSDPGRPQHTWARGTAQVDFRGTGGYVIAPPSTMVSDIGRQGYEILTLNADPRPVDGERIRQLLTPPRPRVAPADADAFSHDAAKLSRWLAGAAEGNRNASLFWAACRLAERGIDEQGIHGLLDRPARTVGLGAREVDATIRSAWRTAQFTPATDVADRSSVLVRGTVRR